MAQYKSGFFKGKFTTAHFSLPSVPPLLSPLPPLLAEVPGVSPPKKSFWN